MKFLALAVLPLLLSAVEPPQLRLPGDVQPTRYELDLNLAPAKDTFDGTIGIDVSVKQPTSLIWLHANGLTIASAKVAGKPATIVPANNEFIGLSLPGAVPAGPAKIEIAYSGQLQKNDVEGLFKQTEGKDSYILTQFEPTSARRAFPCFDEPAFKTPWKITLRVPRAMEAFANTPVESERVSGETKVVQFRESKPLPTYLVAVAVGPFEIIDGGVAGKNKTPLRVITTRGHKNEAKYTLEVTPKVFTALEEYFGIPYPYEKLDQITIPVTVAFGAMENAGLITYQSSLLLMRPQDDTVTRRRTNTSVITHEIAHQWFGNMVTPAWWDDIWLNEAFASWMEERIEETLFPAWKSDVNAVSQKSKVMGLDSLLSARKIRQPIMNEGDIGSAFDFITYTKGSAVIRMFESYVGQDAMRKGIQNYMKKHAWGAATAQDFLKAISDASGKNVTSAFSTFLDRTGVPLLNVTVNCTQGAKPSITISQERFLPLGSKGNRSEYWQVPVCVEYESGGKVSRQCAVVADPKDVVTLQSANACPAWLNANERGSGYYRVRYDTPAQTKLLDNFQKLELREQVDTLLNTQALLSAGLMPASDALALVPKVKDSADREIISAALDIANNVKRSVPAELKPNYSRFMLAMFGAKARALGFESKPGDSDDARLLRPKLIAAAAEHGDKQLVARAKEIASRWLTDRNSAPADISGLALDIAAKYGDKAYFERLVAEFRKSADRRDRGKIVHALGSFRDPAIAQESLKLLLDTTLDIRELSELLYAFSAEPETEHLAWPFLRANYDTLLARLPSRLGNHAGSELPYVGVGFCDEKSYNELESFFQERVKTMPGAERNLALVLEIIQLCGPRREVQRPEVAKFLQSW
jgi:cytosol alanyl aminopeptidase